MPTAIDLFCGCGGLSLGFQNAGFTILRAFDIWDKAINNYNLNFSHPAELQDINQLSPDYLKSLSLFFFRKTRLNTRTSQFNFTIC